MNIGDPAYWEEFYKEEEKNRIGNLGLFDWYCPFEDLYGMLKTLVDTSLSHRILIIGVGRSSIIETLYRDGFRDITAIDISETVITEMQRRYASYSGVEFFILDAKELYKFADSTFTLIFEKGCIDTLFCSSDYLESVTLVLGEIYRVLKQEGIFISTSHAPPIARVPYFRLFTWAIEMYKVPSEIGEALSSYIICKTTNENQLAKKVPGAEAAVRPKAAGVVAKSAADQQAGNNKQSTNKSGRNTGMITITASVDQLAELVDESAEVDS